MNIQRNDDYRKIWKRQKKNIDKKHVRLHFANQGCIY